MGGERADVKRRTDNLKMEGSMEGLVSEAKHASKAIQKVNFNSGKAAAKARNAASSIVVGDDITSTTKAIEQHEAKRQSSASATCTSSSSVKAAAATTSATSLSASAVSKQTKSSGVASTVVQSTDQEAAIQAVNTDKFASSLRESAGVQIGVQKDLSVIDAHRRQSMQQSQQHAQTSSNFFGGQAAESPRWSNSAHAESRQYAQQQSAWSQASQQQQRQYQQQFQQQQQQKMAWQEQQSSTFSASRRKTWAESSVFHGGIAFAGASGSSRSGNATVHYHEAPCPVNQLGGGTGYKFERQTSSGHRLFLPNIA